MPVSRIIIIKAGTIHCEAHEEGTGPLIMLKRWCGVGGGSTVTYVESDRKILVDTGFDFESRIDRLNRKINEKNLVNALDTHGLKPDDIECVIITHHHKDHTGNLHLFPHAELITSYSTDLGVWLNHTRVKDGENIADGVFAVETPGHTRDHLSVIVETDASPGLHRISPGMSTTNPEPLKIGIAGDAIVTAGYYKMGKVWDYNPDYYSEKESMNSMTRLAGMCEYIIPGHGVIFKV